MQSPEAKASALEPPEAEDVEYSEQLSWEAMEEVVGSADKDSIPEEEDASPETIPLISTKESGPVADALD